MDDILEEVVDETEPIDEVEIEEDLQVANSARRKREPSERITPPILGKYAMAKLISVRAKQLEMNRPSTISRERLKSTAPEKIATQELEERIIPLKIIRYLPDNTYEEWSIFEFKYFAKR